MSGKTKSHKHSQMKKVMKLATPSFLRTAVKLGETVRKMPTLARKVKATTRRVKRRVKR